MDSRLPLRISGGVPCDRGWLSHRHSLVPCVLPGWAGHSPGLDSEDLSDEEGSSLRDVGVQLEGIKAPCQDAVLCLDGVQFKEWGPPAEPVVVEGVMDWGDSGGRVLAVPLPPNPLFEKPQLPRVSSYPHVQLGRVCWATASLTPPLAWCPLWHRALGGAEYTSRFSSP